MMGLKAHAIVTLWLLRVIVGTRMEVRGREKLPKPPYLVASKHQSAWDTFALIPIFSDPALVMKAELRHIPFYGWFSRKFEHIFVERSRGPAALRKLERDAQGARRRRPRDPDLPRGHAPSAGGRARLQAGRRGALRGAGLPCVPMALNSGLYWPRRKLMRYPGTIIVEILDPIPAGLPRAEFRTELQARIEAAANRLILEAARRANPPPISAATLAHAEAVVARDQRLRYLKH